MCSSRRRSPNQALQRTALCAAVSLAGCSAVTVYSPDAPPSPRCMLIAPIKYALFIPADSPDRGIPLGELRGRVLESCKEEARDAGANALLITDRSESDSAGRKAFTIKCSGMAYACP
jgi:hypothetical protein